MISGKKHKRRGVSTAAAMLFVLSAACMHVVAADFDASRVLQELAQRTSSKAAFVELKYIAALRQPLVSSGELFFTPPSRLEKHTLKPIAETLILDGDKLIIQRGKRRPMTLSLSSRPEAAGFVESMRATLLGDRDALERYYELDASGSMEDWQLRLVPKEDAMRKIIDTIRISGAAARIKTIEFQQADGDRSLMKITDEGAL